MSEAVADPMREQRMPVRQLGMFRHAGRVRRQATNMLAQQARRHGQKATSDQMIADSSIEFILRGY